MIRKRGLPLTKISIIGLSITNAGLKVREIKHDGALGPVGAVAGVVRDLAQEVVIGLAKLDVDAGAVRAGHGDAFFRVLVVEELADALEHGVGLGDGKRELERQAVQAVLPLGFLARVQSADEHVVVPAVDGPEEDGRVRLLVVKVGGAPEGEKGRLGQLVGRLEVLAAVEQRNGGAGLEVGQRKGVLEALLVAERRGDLVVVAVVELLQVGPPL